MSLDQRLELQKMVVNQWRSDGLEDALGSGAESHNGAQALLKRINVREWLKETN